MILPVIMAGGTGSRLWPMSRKKLPKQLGEIWEKLLEKEYGIKESDIDYINFSNIPEEFKTDEWWKKRGL